MFGKAMRAVSQDADAAADGLNVDNTISFTFALARRWPVRPASWWASTQLDQPADGHGARPGRRSSPRSSAASASFPAHSSAACSSDWPRTTVSAVGFSTFKDAVVYALLILILIVKPAGLLGKDVKEKV